VTTMRGVFWHDGRILIWAASLGGATRPGGWIAHAGPPADSSSAPCQWGSARSHRCGRTPRGTDKSTLSIAFSRRRADLGIRMAFVDPRHPESLRNGLSTSPLRYSPDLKLSARQITDWKWADDKARRGWRSPCATTSYSHDGQQDDHGRRQVQPVRSRQGRTRKLVVGGMLNTCQPTSK